MPFHPGSERLFRKVTSSPVGATWRKLDGEIVGQSVMLTVFYCSAEDVDFSGEIGDEILTRFLAKVGPNARGKFQVRCERIADAWTILSTYRIGEI